MANILKPIGFVLILGAVAAGAYYYGQSSGGKITGARLRNLVSSGSNSNSNNSNNNEDNGDDDDSNNSSANNSATPRTNTPRSNTPRSTKPVNVNGGAMTVPATVQAISGDTVLTAAKAKVHLLGVRTPSQGFDAAHAREALGELLGNGAVRLQFLSDSRTEALVWKGDDSINEIMIRRGWSRAGSSRFQEAEAAAKENREGFWSPEGWMGE